MGVLNAPDVWHWGESYPIPSSVDTVIPKPTKPYVTLDIANLQAFCERCVYFEMQSIWVCTYVATENNQTNVWSVKYGGEMLTLPKMMSFSYHLKGSLINMAVYERLSTSPSFIYSCTVDKKVLLQRMNFHKSYFRASARFILEHCNALVTTPSLLIGRRGATGTSRLSNSSSSLSSSIKVIFT